MENLLAGEASAYLRSAAHQPVHWLPWGDAVFARARAEDKPILLDIGAVWCHWCHVMDGESYEDPAVAGILNRDFVCVKVDRDERPDVDTRYQRAVAAISHLPHLVVDALVAAVVDMDPRFLDVAARGFKDATRIAASDPVVWREIFQQNREALGEALETFRRALDALERTLDSGDDVAIEATLERIRRTRAELG